MNHAILLQLLYLLLFPTLGKKVSIAEELEGKKKALILGVPGGILPNS